MCVFCNISATPHCRILRPYLQAFVAGTCCRCVAHDAYVTSTQTRSGNRYITRSCMGWLRFVGSFKSQVSFAEYRLFYRALLQKRLMILRSLLIGVSALLAHGDSTQQVHFWCVCVDVSCVTHLQHIARARALTHTHTQTCAHVYTASGPTIFGATQGCVWT